MRTNFRNDGGQTAGFVAISMVALIAMTAFVLDVGSWFRADRQLQTVADAAALAGAQFLTYDPGTAVSTATDYAKKNGGPTAESLKVEKDLVTNDTLSVSYSQAVDGLFARILGINTVTVRATAKARSSTPASALWVAPIVVSEKHPLLHCTSPGKCSPEYGVQTDLALDNLKPGGGGPDAAGAFGLLNLNKGDSSGTIGSNELADWLTTGYNQEMTPGVYYSVPSAKFNSSEFSSAIEGKINSGDEILIPIYRKLVRTGSNAEYTIVGWVGFVIEAMIGSGDSAQLRGHFTRVVWDGVPSGSPSDATPDYGAHVVSLTG